MKKSIVLALFVLLFTAGIFAQTPANGDILVTANVNKNVSIISLPSITLGTLDGATAKTVSSTAVIRSNHVSWNVKVYADNAVLKRYDNNAGAYVTGTGLTTIPYTFSFNTASTVAAEKIVGATLTTSISSAATATFTTRTSGGASGQSFDFSVSVPAATAGTDWDAGDYRDVIRVTVTAS